MDQKIKTALMIMAIAMVGMLVGMAIGVSFNEELDCGVPIPQQIGVLESRESIPEGYHVMCDSEECVMVIQPRGLMVEETI